MGIAALIPVLGPAVSKLLDLIPDNNARSKAEAEFNQSLLDAVAAEKAGNHEINKIEAGHRSVFVAGWRPFIGWVCGSGLAYAFLVQPILTWAGLAMGLSTLAGLPEFPMDYLLELLAGMLGIGSLRTLEKLKGAAR